MSGPHSGIQQSRRSLATAPLDARTAAPGSFIELGDGLRTTRVRAVPQIAADGSAR